MGLAEYPKPNCSCHTCGMERSHMAQYIIDRNVTSEFNGVTLYRLILSYAGDQECVGWTDGSCDISNGAYIMGDAIIYCGAVIHSTATVCRAIIEGAELHPGAYVTGSVYVAGGVVSGNIRIGKYH